MSFVVEAKVSDDARTRGICRADFGASVGMPVGLIEIGGLSHIRWNDSVSLTEFCDAIDLDGQKNRDAI